jgi:hypothetical protein
MLASVAFAVVEAEVVRTHPTPGLGAYDAPFFPDGTYSNGVQSPSEFLGFEVGSWPMRQADMIRYFTYLDETLPNVFLHNYATTYEGRTLVYLVIASPENAAKLDAIMDRTAQLADPRRLKDDGAAADIIANHPVTAWMLYGIHGDELSSGDAAVQLAYQLAAGTDSTTNAIRENVVVCIDPAENPDGRERWLKQLEQWNGTVPNPDTQSFNHAGTWPWGRGNHYLFDINRDWFTQVHPETRGKIEAIMQWNPQFLLDCHEMGAMDSYLFSPPRAPFNPYMISQIYKWWGIFAQDQAAAFDRYGWSYYTREWNEELFPGYGSSWGIYIGAIGMLYEQAGVDGSQVMRREGTVMTYRETVHHQFASSMANLKTAADHRKELLEDYYKEKKRAVGKEKGTQSSSAFVFPRSANASRLQRLAEVLGRQKIEVEQATDAFTLRRGRSSVGEDVRDLRVPEGALVVRVSQPQRHLIESILHFDIRIDNDFLADERARILKDNSTELYDATGWSLPVAYNVECVFTESLGNVKTKPYQSTPVSGRLIGPHPNYGYAVDNSDDRSLRLLARLFEKDYKVWAAKEPFEVDGRRFERGSLLIRLNANPNLIEEDLAGLAETMGVDIYGVNTALGQALADLGGEEFVLLQEPHIGLIGGATVSTYQFGSVWHLLDSRMGFRVSTLDFHRLSNMDLRKYNVIVMPSASGERVYKRMLGESGLENLETWVKAGGTLVAMDGAAAFLADTSVAMSEVREKSQVIEKLAEYDNALAWRRAAEASVIDSLDLWEAKPPGGKKAPEEELANTGIDSLKNRDELARRLRPRGAILAANLDPAHWLSFGERSPVPLLVSTGSAYVAKTHERSAESLMEDAGARTTGVEVPARFAGEQRMRLSGLLWPEARERWSETIAVSREALGHGQIILFTVQPNFRGYFHGGERLLLNAIFLGPGFGTRTPHNW